MNIIPMTEELARQIATWKYPGEYGIYSFEPTPEVLEELLGGEYAACVDKHGVLAGYFCYGGAARIPTVEENAYQDSALDIGLGLEPERCGKGLGRDFVKTGMAYGRQRFGEQDLRLTVAAFNRRAIKVYEDSGFLLQKTVTHKSSKAPFWVMVNRRGERRTGARI